MEEEEIPEEKGLNVKGLIDVINDSSDDNLSMYDDDTSLNVQGSSVNLEHTWYLDSRCSRHMTHLKSLLIDFVKKDGPNVVFRESNEEVVTGVGTFECMALKLKKVFYVISSPSVNFVTLVIMFFSISMKESFLIMKKNCA